MATGMFVYREDQESARREGRRRRAAAAKNGVDAGDGEMKLEERDKRRRTGGTDEGLSVRATVEELCAAARLWRYEYARHVSGIAVD